MIILRHNKTLLDLEEQREFGKINEFFKKERRKLSLNLQKKTLNKLIKGNEKVTELSNKRVPIIDENLKRKLLNNEVPRNVEVNISSSNLIGKEAYKVKDGKGTIHIHPETSIDVIAHEIAHSKNRVSKNPLKRYVHRNGGNDAEAVWGVGEGGVSNKESLKDLGNSIKDGFFNIQEEKNANSTAKKILKRQGATKEQLKQFKINRKADLLSHRLQNSASIETKAERVIMPPEFRPKNK